MRKCVYFLDHEAIAEDDSRDSTADGIRNPFVFPEYKLAHDGQIIRQCNAELTFADEEARLTVPPVN